jgi:hypothetical protein
MVGNDAVNKWDRLGLQAQGCTNCDNVLKRAEQWELVKKLKVQKSAKNPTLPCLTVLRCQSQCPNGMGFAGGWYAPGPGEIVLACQGGGKKEFTVAEIEQVLRHELAHTESQCRDTPGDCDSCMKEEKQAYFRAGQCKTDQECTQRAWGSCTQDGLTNPCKDKKMEDYYGVGDPTTGGPGGGPLPPIPPVPTGP